MKREPRPLLVLHEDAALLDRIRRHSGDGFVIRRLQGWPHLHQAVAGAPPAAVVLVDPHHEAAGGGELSPHLHDLLRSFPSATVVAAMDVTPDRHDDLRHLAEWGVSEILQSAEDITRHALRWRLTSARAQHLHALLNRDGRMPLSGRARSLMEAAVTAVLAGGHPRDMAQELGFSPSTLLRWCDRSQLPNPRRLLLWLRTLFASALLDDPGHTVRSVGLACGYSGDQALRRAIRSVVPYTPTQLRTMGAFDAVSDAFFRELEALHDDEAERR